MFTLPKLRPTSDVFCSSYTMKNGLSYPRESYCDVANGSGYRYERCSPVVGSLYVRLSYSGDARSPPSSRPERLDPFWMNDPCVSAKFTVAPMRSFSVSSRLPFTRDVNRAYSSLGPTMKPSWLVYPSER